MAGYVTARYIMDKYMTSGYITAEYITAGYIMAGLMTAGYIMTSSRQKCACLDIRTNIIALALESSRRALKPVTHWHIQLSYFSNRTNDVCMYMYTCIHIYIYIS